MKVITKLLLALVFISFIHTSCGTKSPADGAATVEEAEAQLANKRKQDAKTAKKAKKKSEKHYWSLQSKAAKKSIKRNKRRQKRKAKGLD